MTYPVPVEMRMPLFWVAFLLQLVSTLVLTSAEFRTILRTEASPMGIISLQLAWNAARADRILEAWGTRGQRYAKLSIWFDFFYILGYSTSLSLACMWAAGLYDGRSPGLAALGVPLAWGQWFAGACDVLENLSTLQILPRRAREPWPHIITIFAALKFLILAAGLLYVLAAIFPYSPFVNSPESR
jgi:hypothetical protein